MTRACPHENPIYCPIYVASHMAIGISCDDGRLNEGGCAAGRGLNYAETVAVLMDVRPSIVKECYWSEWLTTIREQRLRNMSLNGVR